MDYHRDRFEDYSLLIRTEKGELLAVLPAHKQETILSSHMGLTYGGFVVAPEMKTGKMLDTFASVIEFLRNNGFSSLVYKTVPYIYHTVPAEEDRYALHLCRAERFLSSPAVVVPRCGRLPYQTRRLRGIKRAVKEGIRVEETNNFADFWEILERNLGEVHASKPVHSLTEMLLLKKRCPDHIRLFGAFEDGDMLAGVLIYESAQVAHVQYIASGARGRDISALDLLFHVLITQDFANKKYFDFGTSSTGSGGVNAGLLDQKEGFGARAVTQDWYRIDLTAVSTTDVRSAAV